jgi:hypothetical protein
VTVCVPKTSSTSCDQAVFIDQAWRKTLAAYVARHALTVDSPIREYYLVGQRDTPHRAAADRDRLADLPHTPATACEPAPET